MSTAFSPLCAAVAKAAQQQQQVRIVGGNCHNRIGFSSVDDAQDIDLKEFHSVNFYSPAELVVSAQAGVKISDLSALLAEQKQRFSCSFRNLSALFGKPSNDATLGGGIAVNLSGSDRVNHYAIRDSVLGVEVVNAEGQLITMGGRVFKNVTGYDLSKLMIGSLGTLGIIASVNMRLRPLAETEASLCLDAPDVVQATHLMTLGLNGPLDVSGAFAEQSDAGYRLFLRVEGFCASVQERIHSLKALFKDHDSDIIEGKESYEKWLNINNLKDFSNLSSSMDIWLLSQPASRAPEVEQVLRRLSPDCRIALDWGGAQVWCASPDHLFARDIRAACQNFSATVRPIRVSPEQAKGAFSLDPATRKLLHRLYQEFDPQNVFQRQRLYDDL